MRKRIPIVEDEASVRDMVAFVLRKADMEVAQAADARGRNRNRRCAAGPDPAGLDAAWDDQPGTCAAPASRAAYRRSADHHVDRALHGARMGIESEPGEGSTVTCVFDNRRVLTRGTDDA